MPFMSTCGPPNSPVPINTEISPKGWIFSPSYPANYPPHQSCVWNISVTTHHTLVITVYDIDFYERIYIHRQRALEAATTTTTTTTTTPAPITRDYADIDWSNDYDAFCAVQYDSLVIHTNKYAFSQVVSQHPP